MRKHRINCPIVVDHVLSHKNCRDNLLSLIKQSSGGKICNHHDQISSTDFFCQNAKKLYQPLILSMIDIIVLKMTKEFFYECGRNPTALWYQQYQKNDTHSWHNHANGQSTLSIIYYLELPKGTPGTEFKDPFTKRIHRPKVKEGDIIMFPSFVDHRSPQNRSNQTKTIISMNLY